MQERRTTYGDWASIVEALEAKGHNPDEVVAQIKAKIERSVPSTGVELIKGFRTAVGNEAFNAIGANPSLNVWMAEWAKEKIAEGMKKAVVYLRGLLPPTITDDVISNGLNAMP